MDEYGYIVTDGNIKIGDTVKIKYSSNTYFKFVFFNNIGKSYCEIYKDFKLYKKGYFESSLDTLKKYSYTRGVVPSFNKIYVFKYFQPLKNGIWDEYRNGKCYKRRVFDMGIEVMSGTCKEIK